MRYFKSHSGQTFAYDENMQDQIPYMLKAIDSGWEEITGEWPPSSDLDDLISSYELKLDQIIDAYAQSWGYNSIVSAASYSTSSVDQFRMEAAALIGWRDSVWTWASKIVSNIKKGLLAPPSSFELLTVEMPKPPARPIVG